MIIDIDIKIADSHGKMLQHLAKRFDTIDPADDRLTFSLDIGKSFEQFLSEYLSYSGRRIQDKLFTDTKFPASGRLHLSGKNFPSDELSQPTESLPSTKTLLPRHQENVLPTDFSAHKKLEDREIEYHIRIGNGNIFSGKFPVEQLFQARDTIHRTQEAELPKNYETGCEDLNHLMQKAIEKYETTFYHIAPDQKAEVEELFEQC